MTTRPTALEVRGLSVSFYRDRGLVGIALLIPWLAWIFHWIPWLKGYLTRHLVIDGLDLEVPQNTIYGIFGVNGAGKSSLLRAICGVEPPDAGEILLHGVPVSRSDPKARAFVMNRSNRELSGDFTVTENMIMTAKLYGLDPAGAVATATSLLKMLGVKDEDIEKYPNDLSVGTRGKVCVVRALLPLLAEQASGSAGRVLLLDEPTIGFDAVAVEQFFSAVRALRDALPNLTIVIATNDPREMSLCDDFTAIVDGKPSHDVAAFSLLRSSMAGYSAGIQAAATMIGRPINSATAGAPALDSVPKIPPSTTPPTAALAWRHWRDQSKNWLANLMVVVSLVVPNFVAAFAAARDPWHTLVVCTLAILASLMIRDSGRFLDRERGYYNMLETLVTSPVTRLAHFLETARLAIMTQLGFTVIFSIILSALLGFPAGPVLQKGGIQAVEMWLAAGCVAVGVIIVSFAFGMLTAIIPFATRGQIAAYFFINMVPMLAVLCGGVYYDASRLPPGLSHIAHANPLTYGTAAISHFFELGRNTDPALSRYLLWLIPGLSAGWANVLAMFLLALPIFGVSALILGKIEPILRRAGRLRNYAG